MPRVNPLAAKLQQAEAALALAETKIQEQRDVMTDLLLLLGSRKTCAKCNTPVFWLMVRGHGAAVMYNPDGTQHWPRCPGTARPAELSTAVGE